MLQVHQTQEMIWVRTGDQHYGETYENFARDYGKPAPLLPPGIADRQYEPNVRHALAVNNSVVDGGPMPWTEGDSILKAASQLHTRKEAREVQMRAEAEAKAKADLEQWMKDNPPKPSVVELIEQGLVDIRERLAKIEEKLGL